MSEENAFKVIRISEKLHAEVKAEAAVRRLKLQELMEILLDDGISRLQSGKLTIRHGLAK